MRMPPKSAGRVRAASLALGSLHSFHQIPSNSREPGLLRALVWESVVVFSFLIVLRLFEVVIGIVAGRDQRQTRAAHSMSAPHWPDLFGPTGRCSVFDK